MSRFSTSEAARFETTLTELYAVVPADVFPSRTLQLIQRLIGSVHSSYNEVDIARSRHRVVMEPAELFRVDLDGVFGRYLHQHPVISHVAATGDPRSRLITDFMTRTAFRKLELYNDLYRHVGTETQLSVTLPTRSGEIVAFALNRGRSGFSERERELLDRLGPHLTVSHDNARRFSEALAGTGGGDRHASRAAIGGLTDRQCEILELVADGKTNAQIGYLLGISPSTVKKHLEHIGKRLRVDSRTAAAAQYIRATTRPPAG